MDPFTVSQPPIPTHSLQVVQGIEPRASFLLDKALALSYIPNLEHTLFLLLCFLLLKQITANLVT